jgi:hypothetical protein
MCRLLGEARDETDVNVAKFLAEKERNSLLEAELKNLRELTVGSRVENVRSLDSKRSSTTNCKNFTEAQAI